MREMVLLVEGNGKEKEDGEGGRREARQPVGVSPGLSGNPSAREGGRGRGCSHRVGRDGEYREENKAGRGKRGKVGQVCGKGGTSARGCTCLR